MVSTFVFLPLLVQSFGVSVYGVLALATSVSSYALLLDLGVSATLTRMVAERTARDDTTGVRGAIFSASAIYGALGLAVGAIMFVLGAVAGDIFNVSPQEATLLTTLLWIGAGQQVWYWPTVAARDALAGLQRYDLVSAVTLGTVAVDIAGTIFVLVTGRGPVALISIRVAGMVIASVVNMVLLSRILPSAHKQRAKASRDDAREILRSGSSVFVLQIAQVMSRQQTDKLVLGVFVGTAAVTLYDIAAKLNSLITTFTGLTVSAILPVAAEMNVREQHESLRALFLKGTKLIAALIAPLTTVMIVIAAPFIAAWFGPGFEGAVPVAQVLLLSQIFLPLYQLGDQILIGRDRFHLWVPGGLTLAVLNVVLSVLLVGRYGLIGVAVGTLVAVMLELPWYMIVFSKEMRLGIGEWLRTTAWPLYPLLAVAAVVAFAGTRTGLSQTLIGLAIVGALACAVYWIVVAFAGFSAQERDELVALVSTRGAGAER